MVAKGDLPLDIFWSLNSIPIIAGEHSFSILRVNARTSVLSVDSLDAKHRGIYKCMARNKAGHSEHHSELHVNGLLNTFFFHFLFLCLQRCALFYFICQSFFCTFALTYVLHNFCTHTVPPQIAPFDFGEKPANTGDVAAVWCMVAKGDLPLDIFWSLNSVPIITGEHSFTILRMNARTSALTIEALDAKHRGIYKCLARNSAGMSEYHSELEVNGAFYSYKILSIFFLCLSFSVPQFLFSKSSTTNNTIRFWY